MCNGCNGKLQDKCGVIGVKNSANATLKVWDGLYALQHRGQESAGISVYADGRVTCEKGMGLLSDAVNEAALSRLPVSDSAIGHVRYSALDLNTLHNVEPQNRRSAKGWISIASNGCLINAHELEEKIFDAGMGIVSTNDTEMILNLVIRYWNQDTLENAVIATVKQLKGAYATVLMTENQLIGVRDPYGVKPLCIGQFEDGGWCIASESCALDTVGAQFIRDVRPGEMIIADDNGLTSVQAIEPEQTAMCIFEYVYTARPDSVIDEMSVYKARFEMGRRLAQIAPVDADLVAGAPDSALPAAKGFAYESGIPYRDALVRNRFMGRTFILPEQSMRERGVYLKLSALSESVKGKSVVLVDDSIVRGTTSKKIVQILRNAGAREVHLRIASPPVKFPCRYGVDTPTTEELASAVFSTEYIRDMVKADSLEYIDYEGLLSSVAKAKIGMCTACFNGQYPIK